MAAAAAETTADAGALGEGAGWTEVFSSWSDGTIRQALVDKGIVLPDEALPREELLKLASQVFASDYLPASAPREEAQKARRASAVTTSDSKRGYVWKQAVSGKARWKRRLFELDDGVLRYSHVKYYSKGHSAEIKGRFVLTADFYVVADMAELEPAARARGISTELGAALGADDDDDDEEEDDVAKAAAPAPLGKEALGSGRGGASLLSKPVASKMGSFRKTKGPPTKGSSHSYPFALVTATTVVRLACDSEEEVAEWTRALRFAIAKIPSDDGITGAGTAAAAAAGGASKRGFLVKRAVHSGENWKTRFFVLRGATFTYYEAEQSVDAKGSFALSADCSVHETRRQFTFKLVTPHKVLDARASSAEDMANWITALRGAIEGTCVARGMDPVQARAFALPDDFYEVTYATKVRLGLQTQKRGNWAAVHKLSEGAPEGVRVGDMIAAVNGAAVALSTYGETLDRIKGWQPPLTLRLRRAPTKVGTLVKRSRGQTMMGRNNWKQRHVVLGEGALTYFESAVDTKPKGTMSLVGSAVANISGKDCAERAFCFRVVGATGNLILQAASAEEQLDWASAVYHAIAVANGGRYLLDRERQGMFANAGGFGAMTLSAKPTLDGARGGAGGAGAGAASGRGGSARATGEL